MTGGGAQEIVAGIWCWQRRLRGLRPGQFGTRTSYAMIANGQTLLVDRLVDGDDDPVLGALDDLAGGRVQILISKPFHTRGAELLWRRFGDAIVDTGGGELRVWDGPLDGDRRRRWWRERYLPALELLAALDIEHVLVTHGRAVLSDGAAALHRALEHEPWQRPKR
jgi:glyoxylase-like metal-dependent hydrolase (beta-lactamase superfamily II)